MSGREADGRRESEPEGDEDPGGPASTAPDAVMDPSQKTEGKPGLGPRNGRETDPGSG